MVVEARAEAHLLEPLPRARAAIRSAADTLTPDQRAGDFAQAMMDLGATICTARNPRCPLCPLAGECKARAMGDPAAFPAKPAKKPKPQRHGTAFWIERDGAVWLVRRPGKGMLGGMRALPDDGWSARADGDRQAPLAGPWRAGGSVGHVFTHFALDLALSIYEGKDWPDVQSQAREWWPTAQIEQAGLPTLFAKAARLGVSAREEQGDGSDKPA